MTHYPRSTPLDDAYDYAIVFLFYSNILENLIQKHRLRAPLTGYDLHPWIDTLVVTR